MHSTPPCDEKALFLLIAQGDKHAFKTVFDLFKGPFHAAAFKMTRNAHTAEEIVQEVFILLWTKRARVAAADNPTHYLFTVLYNSIYAHFKKTASEKQLRRALSRQTTTWEEAPMELLLQAKENRQALDHLLDKLPRQQQMVYKLSKLEGMSREEVASQMQISPHSVKNHLHHAVKFIRLYLKHRKAISLFILIITQGL